MGQNYAGALTLFERLTASEKRKRVTHNDVVASVIAEIQRIAETKSYFQKETDNYEGNILQYGLRNLLDFRVPDKLRLQELCKALDKAITDYEPRIKKSKSSITKDKSGNVTDIMVEAILHDIEPGKKVIFKLPLAGMEAEKSG